MKASNKNILIIIITAGVLMLLGVIILDRSSFDDKELVKQGIRPKVVIDQVRGSWPMFRGGQGLLGRASGTLADSLELLWRFKTEGQVKSSPAIGDGLVFVGSSDANVYAIDLASGNRVWAYRTGGDVEAGPCVVDGSVYIGSSDRHLYAFDANSGAFKWKYKTGGKILGSANWTSSPDKRDTRILVGSYDSKLHCVDANSGNLVWAYETDSYVNGAPAVDGERVVFGGCDGMIHVVSLSDGSHVAEIDAESYIAASAVVANGRAYVGNYEETFFCADIIRGKVLWRYPNPDFPFYSSPALGQDVVVVGSRDKRLHCVSRTSGDIVWTFQTGGDVDSSPVICGDKVVVGSGDGRLYVIRLSDGKKVWSYEIGQPIVSSPAVASGIVVVGCDDGYVYAFGPKW